MPTIEPYAARGVWDPPMYSQAVKVSGAQTILYIAGQVAYGPDGNPVHAGDREMDDAGLHHDEAGALGQQRGAAEHDH